MQHYSYMCVFTRPEDLFSLKLSTKHRHRTAFLPQHPLTMGMHDTLTCTVYINISRKFYVLATYIHVHTYTYTCTCYVPALNYFLQSECLRPPADDCLRQMSGLIEGHRNGVLGPPLTEWLKNLIRAHCSGCRDPECKVPHLAVGW